MNFEPIAGTDWEDLKPDLRDALRNIAVRAAGRLRISLQHAIDGHFSAFDAAATRDRVSHQLLARLLFEAGVVARNGEAPSAGSFSSALSRARANHKANARRAVFQPKPANTPVDAKSSATADGGGTHSHKAKPEICSLIEPAAPRSLRPSPVDVPHAVFAETPMSSALRRGRLLNELKWKRTLS
ncbi:MAG: hypothetical protein ABSF67_01380 [Roseiarcus sp.]